MRSNSTQVFVVFLAFVGTCLAAFYLPFIMAGERLETRPDIVLTARFTATATPLDRALTREAFALRFFTPTDSLAVALIVTPTPASTATRAVFPAVISFGTLPGTATGTVVVVFVPNTGATRTVHRPDEQPPIIIVSNTPRPPSPTAIKTATRQPTVTAAPTATPANTSTPRPPTPRPTFTPRPTNTPTSPPTSTPIPPTDTPEPPTVEPPTVEPPTVEPPTVEPPTVEPPTVEPPTSEPPTSEPTTEPPILGTP